MGKKETITSPFTNAQYEIRELPRPLIQSLMVDPSTTEFAELKSKYFGLLDDMKIFKATPEAQEANKENIKNSEEEMSRIQIILTEKTYQSGWKTLTKIVQYGCLKPKFQNEEDIVNLGEDAEYVYARIYQLSNPDSEKYKEVISNLFRGIERPDQSERESGADNSGVTNESKQVS